jgi:hypothetical protein
MENLSPSKIVKNIGEMSLSELKKTTKQLQAQGYNVDYDKIKAKIEGKSDDERSTYFTKKILKALANTTPPADNPKSPRTRSRSTKTKSGALKIEPLDKNSLKGDDLKNFQRLKGLNLRGPAGNIDLYTIMQHYNIKGRSSSKLNKEEKILSILAAIQETGNPLSAIFPETGSEEPVELKKKSKKSASPVKPSKPSSPKKVTKPVQSDEDEDDEPAPVKVKDVKPSKPSSPKKVTKPVQSDEDEDDEPAPVKVNDVKPSKPSSPKKSSPVVQEKLSYEQLLDKRLEELKEILEEKGVIDNSKVVSKEKAADLIKQLDKRGFCSDDNTCKKGNVCDITTKPGICVKKSSVKEDEDSQFFEYNGRTIIGTKKAIDNFKKLMVPPSDEDIDDPTERKKLLKKATLISSRDRKLFENLSNQQIKELLEGYGIEENPSAMKKFIAKKTPLKKQQLSKMPIEELIKRANLINQQFLEDIENNLEDRDEMIEFISAWTNRPPSKYQKYETSALKQRLEELKEWSDKKDNIASIISYKPKKKPSDFDKWTNTQIQEYTDKLSSKYQDKAARKAIKNEQFFQDIEDNEGNRDEMIDFISSWTNRPRSEYEKYEIHALKQRVEELQKWIDKKDNITEILSYKPKKKASDFDKWTDAEILEYKEKLGTKYQDKASNAAKATAKALLESKAAKATAKAAKATAKALLESKAAKATAKAAKALLQSKVGKAVSKVASTAVKDVSNSSDSDDEEDESKVAKVSSQSDEASEIEEKPAKEINKKDIDRLLDQIMSGKKENIDDLEAAQKSVLKCFGLIA